MTNDRLTDFQTGVLTVIKDLSKGLGYPPSMREIATGMGYANPEPMVSSIRSAIAALTTRGYLTSDKGIARSYVATGKEK